MQKGPHHFFFNWGGIGGRGKEDSSASHIPAVFPAHISFIEPSPDMHLNAWNILKNECNCQVFDENDCLLVHANEANFDNLKVVLGFKAWGNEHK